MRCGTVREMRLVLLLGGVSIATARAAGGVGDPQIAENAVEATPRELTFGSSGLSAGVPPLEDAETLLAPHPI